MRSFSLSQVTAIADQIIKFQGFVEEGIRTCCLDILPHRLSYIVADNDCLLRWFPAEAAMENFESISLRQKQIDKSEVPFVRILRKPVTGLTLGAYRRHYVRVWQSSDIARQLAT